MKKLVSFALALALCGTFLPLLPAQAAGDMGATVSAGSRHTMMIKEDGSLWAYGWNLDGQFGNGKEVFAVLSPVKEMEKVMDNVRTVSASAQFSTMAVKQDGTLWATGDNTFGELGLGTEESTLSWTKVMDGVQDVSAGPHHTLILKTDGSLWGCGHNSTPSGNILGVKTTNAQLTPIKIMDEVKAASAGGNFSMILKNDNSLWACGQNEFGQLGITDPFGGMAPVKVMDNVKSVSAGQLQTLIVKLDGGLWVCGYNGDGVLGTGQREERIFEPVKVADDVRYAATTSGNHSAIIKNDGSLWTCGRNQNAALGDGTQTDRQTFVKVIDSGVEAVTVGGNNWEWYTVALKSDGTLWCCSFLYFDPDSVGGMRDHLTPFQATSGILLPGGKTAQPVTPPPIEDYGTNDQSPSPWAADAAAWTLASDELAPLFDGTWQNIILRDSFAIISVVMVEEAIGQKLPAAPDTTFADAKSPYVRKAYQAGIVTGTSENTFDPELVLTREQLATMLHRAITYIEGETGKRILTQTGTLEQFTDKNQVSDWAAEAVASLAANDIMKGTGETTLSPQSTATIEQALVLAQRVLAGL